MSDIPLEWMLRNTPISVDENHEVVFVIIHIHDEVAWVRPKRVTRVHEHQMVNGSCWCQKDQLVSINRLTSAPLNL